MKKIIGVLLLFLVTVGSIKSQTGYVKGFVLDATNGNPVIGASVWLDGTTKGVSTNELGYFQLNKIPVGNIILNFRSIGFAEKQKSLLITDGQISNTVIQLKPKVLQLGTATISGKRQKWEDKNTVSIHSLTAKTIDRIPSLSGTPDLADYLQVVPGIVFTGDMGGQFYIRGGAPVQNLVKMDGMTVINPFHSIGFVSVFDTETLASVDVYTAGFSAGYGGRLSSVIDIRTRPGNRKRFAGVLNTSGFGYGLTLDLPLLKMTDKNPQSISLLVSNKRSYIDRIDEYIYPHLGEQGIPYRYNDLFAKLSFMGIYGDQLDVMGTRITDHAWLSGNTYSKWANTAGGVRFITSPNSSNWLYQASTYYSDYRGEFIEEGESPRNTYFNSYENRMKVFRMGEIADWDIGLSMDLYNTNHRFKDMEGVVKDNEYFTTELVTYIANKTRIGKWLLEPGLHLVYYADQTFFSPEPRFKAKYSLSPSISFNMATGWYTQNLVSTTSERDIIALFQGYYMGPALVQNYYHGELIINKIQQAWHLVGGFTILTKKDIKFSVEGYYKDFVKLVNYNRNRMYRDSELTGNVPGYLKKFFLIEEGQAYGADFLMDYQKNDFSLWMGYSLAWVFREDERHAYVPHYDRRHNLNMLAGYKLGRNKQWNLKARWNIGSGFPFTQTNGVYEDVSLLYGSYLMDMTFNGDMEAWFAELNGARLPWYHRLDISLQRKIEFSETQKLDLNIGIINLYNRDNLFYMNRLSYERINQFPILPNISVKYSF